MYHYTSNSIKFPGDGTINSIYGVGLVMKMYMF